jgi:hypothetical protein
LSAPGDRVAIWYLDQDHLAWFCFVDRRDALTIAKRLRNEFQKSAAVFPYDWEPEPEPR